MEHGVFTAIAVVAVIFVNGATDAPNSVAGAVASGALSYTWACALCAVFNFAGMLLSSLLFPSVAMSMEALVARGETGIGIALISVVLFSSLAWLLGIPTSESHGLIASLGGVSLYYTGVAGKAFYEITLKSALSCAVGALAGASFFILMKPFIYRGGALDCARSRVSIAAACAGGASFCHGMQDGQKFIAMLTVRAGGASFAAVVICSAVMALGCFAGGRRIINKLGCDLTGGTSEEESVASDAGAFICTVVSSLIGIPVSTTYMKTCSMLGSAAAAGRRADVRTLAELVGVWMLTYPACMGIAYVLCALTEAF